MRRFLSLAAWILTFALLVGAAPVPRPKEDLITGANVLKKEEDAELAAIKEYEDSKKYFHEPGSDDLLGHYDSRYFEDLLSYEDKRDAQVHMIRAYLETFRQKGIETWIAHGTLLGWWWNGKMLPWDWDIDTQISEGTLKYLATNLNHTRHTYSAASSSLHNNDITRTYLLDVNPHWAERSRGDGFNIIDARWIDVQSGLYIDITALSEIHSDVLRGMLSCKNLHRYDLKDLYPMRETMYEGVVAKVPYNYDLVLINEYREDALVTTEFEGHIWDRTSKEWVKQQAAGAQQ